MESQDNPINALLTFFEKLPSTIKKDVIALVLVYAFRDINFDASTDLEERLRNNLKQGQPTPMQTIGAILSTIAAADYVLDSFTQNATKHRRMIARLVQMLPKYEKIQLGHALRQKHFERARLDFDLLKQDALNFRMLQVFENSLQRQQMGL